MRTSQNGCDHTTEVGYRNVDLSDAPIKHAEYGCISTCSIQNEHVATELRAIRNYHTQLLILLHNTYSQQQLKWLPRLSHSPSSLFQWRMTCRRICRPKLGLRFSSPAPNRRCSTWIFASCRKGCNCLSVLSASITQSRCADLVPLWVASIL